jgi:cytochrome c5
MRGLSKALVAASVLVLCAVALSARAQTPDPALTPPPVETPAPNPDSSSALPPAPEAVPFALIDAPGREAVERECSVCHELSRIGEHGGRTRDEWDYLIRFMAPMSEETLTEVVDYLAANYGLPEAAAPAAPAPTESAPAEVPAPASPEASSTPH